MPDTPEARSRAFSELYFSQIYKRGRGNGAYRETVFDSPSERNNSVRFARRISPAFPSIRTVSPLSAGKFQRALISGGIREARRGVVSGGLTTMGNRRGRIREYSEARAGG